MAGRGPAPKDQARRARRNADPVATTVVTFVRADQPALPEGLEWPEATVTWWAVWRDSPLSEHFMATDWQFMLDTALLHRAVWGRGDTSVLPELRLRLAKVGATPEDRARLRISFAEADDADGGQRQGAPRPSRERRGALVVLPGGGQAAGG